MAYEDPRTVERDDKGNQQAKKKREHERDDERWDSQDDCDYRYTDWASI